MPEPVPADIRRCGFPSQSWNRRGTVMGRARAGNSRSQNARFCRAFAGTRRRALFPPDQGLAARCGGLRTSTGRGGRLARLGGGTHVVTMRIPLLAPFLVGALVVALAGTAAAQVDHRFPGASSGQFTPPPPAPTPSIPPGGAPIQAYPNTESFARDRIQSEGYKVQRIERQVDGTWKADTTRDPPLSPPQRQRVPTKVTIFPDGRMLQE